MIRSLQKTLTHLIYLQCVCSLRRDLVRAGRLQQCAASKPFSSYRGPLQKFSRSCSSQQICHKADILENMSTDKTGDRSGGGDIDWHDRWQNNRIGFHKDIRHPTLLKYLDAMTAGKQGCRIFFPLCGKSIDMKWLADMGHTVVGVEFVEKAIQDFFQEQNVEFSVFPVDEIPNAKLYKSKDSKLQLYKCSFFDVTSEALGVFDCIYDRGSLIALEKHDRKRYVDLIVTLMKPECNYLIETVDYDSTKMKGPPFDVQFDDFNMLYSPHCDIKVLEKDVDSLSERMKTRGLDWMTSSDFMLTLK